MGVCLFFSQGLLGQGGPQGLKGDQVSYCMKPCTCVLVQNGNSLSVIKK